MQRFLAMLVIPVALIASGCVGQTIFGGGLTIDEFAPDFQSIFPGEEVNFNIKITNTGSIDAKIKDIELTGLDTSNWKIKTNTCDSLLRSGVNAEGTVTCNLVVVSPNTGNLEITFTPKLHVTYSYKTTSVALVSVGTLDEVRRISLQGGNLPYQTQATTGGPVNIAIAASGPIRVSGSSVEFPIRVTVDAGSGTVCSSACNENTWNKIRVRMDSMLKTSDCPSEMELALFQGQSNSYVCNMQATPSDAGAGITQKRIEITSDYDYITQKSTTISIKKRTI